jgi:preprotein translocase subunit SecB|tara:strand:+ start:338 stop:766 length:429 start_codon:yes stop_codon:yes gene_type:complete
MMTEKFKILTSYIKDMSSETPNVETFIFVQNNINKYQLYIDITSKALKNKMIEVNTTLKFEDKEPNEKKSYYEIVYSTIVSISDEIQNNKKELQKIILCDVPTAIYPKLEKAFLNLIHDSGHPNINFDKKIDFNKLYSEKFN